MVTKNLIIVQKGWGFPCNYAACFSAEFSGFCFNLSASYMSKVLHQSRGSRYLSRGGARVPFAILSGGRWIILYCIQRFQQGHSR